MNTALRILLLAMTSVAAPSARAEDAAAPELVLDPQGFTSLVYGLAFSPDETLLAAGGEKEVRIWDVTTGRLVATLRGERSRTAFGNVYAVAFAPDGRHLAVGIHDDAGAGSIRIYSTADFSEIEQVLQGHRVATHRLTFASDGSHLVSAGSDGELIYWSWPQRQLLRRIPVRHRDYPTLFLCQCSQADPRVLVGLDLEGPFLRAIPSGELLHPGDPRVPASLTPWLMKTAESHQGAPAWQLPPGGGRAIAVRASHLGSDPVWVGAGEGIANGVGLFWAAAWKGVAPAPVSVYRGHSWRITAATLSPASRLAATADQLGEIHVWEAATGVRRHKFASVGKSLYEVANAPPGARLVFGNTVQANGWDVNRRGPAHLELDLARRLVRNAQPELVSKLRHELTSRDGRTVTSALANDGKTYLTCHDGQQRTGRLRLATGSTLTAYSFLARGVLGARYPCVFGDKEGVLTLWDTDSDRERRQFIGHSGYLTAICELPEARLIATSSTDRTIRLWSVADADPVGGFDFKQEAGVVYQVDPGGSSQRAGVQAGYRFVNLAGLTLGDIDERLLRGAYPYKPGDQATVTMQRPDGSTLRYEMTLVRGFDIQRPVLSMFFQEPADWIFWTDQGYYDASAGAQSLIGWHVNRGKQRSAAFYPVAQFKKEFCRPDVIDAVLSTGSDAQAATMANAEAGLGDARDLRDPAQFAAVQPPALTITGIPPTRRTNAERLTLNATASGGQAVRSLKVLVNGAIAAVADVAAGSAAGAIASEVRLKPGENWIVVVAENGQSQAVEKFAVVREAAAPAPVEQKLKPVLRVLTIGIAEYAHPEVPRLYCAHNDAVKIAELFQRQSAGPMYREVRVRTLVNAEADRAGMLEALSQLIQEAKDSQTAAEDVTVLFISGHGFLEGREYYLAAQDTDPGRLLSSGIPWSQLISVIIQVRGRRVLLLDTCHSAGVAGAAASPFNHLVDEGIGAAVITSSSVQGFSQELSEAGLGAFAQALVDTMTSKAADPYPPTAGDGQLSLTELYAFIQHRVRTLTNDEQQPQRGFPVSIGDPNLFHVLP